MVFTFDEMNIWSWEGEEYTACIVVLLISTASCTQYTPEKCWTGVTGLSIEEYHWKQYYCWAQSRTFLYGGNWWRNSLLYMLMLQQLTGLAESKSPPKLCLLYSVWLGSICFQDMFSSILNSYVLVQPNWWFLETSSSTTLLDKNILKRQAMYV
jgi:hypothetical protein